MSVAAQAGVGDSMGRFVGKLVAPDSGGMG